jgi:hypothetical protein
VKGPSEPTSIALGFGFDQYFGLAAAGVLGMVPVASWVVSISSLASSLPTPSGAAEALLQGGLTVIALLVLLVAPPLVPCLVLRARQPLGASVAWDDDGVVEREGAWRRASIPWRDAEAARVTWDVPGRMGKRTYTAIQIFDRITNEVITAWEDRPPGAPLVRRRLMAPRIASLADALERKSTPLGRAADWTRVVEAVRTRPSRGVLALMRLGYVGGALAPILAFPLPAWGVAVGVASAILLAWRARPSVAEALALRARLRSQAAANNEPGEDPYRAAPRPAARDEAPAERKRLRAVTLEVAVRLACAVLPIAASLANALRPAP